jgi:hypothetical protein
LALSGTDAQKEEEKGGRERGKIKGVDKGGG